MGIERGIRQSISLEELAPNSSQSILEEARDLLLEYGRFVIAQPGAGRFCLGSLEREAAGLPGSYLEQGGGCLVAFADTEPAGIVAWRALPDSVEPNTWEMKRLWVRPLARGLGLGKTLTIAILDRARAAERRAVYLDTAPSSMGFAHRLYLELGFEACAPYNDNLVEGLAYLRLKF